MSEINYNKVVKKLVDEEVINSRTELGPSQLRFMVQDGAGRILLDPVGGVVYRGLAKTADMELTQVALTARGIGGLGNLEDYFTWCAGRELDPVEARNGDLYSVERFGLTSTDAWELLKAGHPE
jgi:hypothetical protein